MNEKILGIPHHHLQIKLHCYFQHFTRHCLVPTGVHLSLVYVSSLPFVLSSSPRKFQLRVLEHSSFIKTTLSS